MKKKLVVVLLSAAMCVAALGEDEFRCKTGPSFHDKCVCYYDSDLFHDRTSYHQIGRAHV